MAVDHSENKKRITVAEVESFLATAQSCVQELLMAARQLPKVDGDGYSECDFAEQLYATKEEAQKKTQGCLEKLGEYQSWVEEQIGRCQANLSTVSSGKSALSTDGPRDRLSEAEEKLSAFCKKLGKLREKIDEVFRQMQSAIKEASQKQFPGRIPRKNPQFSPSSNYSSKPMGSPSPKDSEKADDELKEIIAMGPLETDRS